MASARPSASSRPAMNSSMVSRKPSGSNSAAAAASASSTTPPCSSRLRGRAGCGRRPGFGRARFRSGWRPSARPDQAQPERKEARSRAQSVDQRIAERRDKGGQKNAQQANARNDAPAPHSSSPRSLARSSVMLTRPCGPNSAARHLRPSDAGCSGPTIIEPDASSYSITSSARASSVGGTSRPSALAVLRLITSSYLVGACTGRSAGFSPLRMRST